MARIPCGHKVATIFRDKGKLETYVDNCYSKETFLKCYVYHINLILRKEILALLNVGYYVNLTSKGEDLDKEA